MYDIWDTLQNTKTGETLGQKLTTDKKLARNFINQEAQPFLRKAKRGPTSLVSQWANIKRGMRIPEQQLVSIAATYMEDPARQWFDSLDNTPNTWKEFSSLLIGRFFSPEVQRQWINSLRDMRQGPDQSVEDLAGQLDLHFTRLNVSSDSDKCNHLLNVLEPEIGDELLINPQQDYESSVRAAIRFANKEKITKRISLEVLTLPGRKGEHASVA
ncbi:unnamed protein product [Umbelopsis ramanniana]